MKQSKKPAQLSVQVSEREYYKVLFIAEEQGLTISELLRRIIEEYIENYEADRELKENDRIKASRSGPASDKQMQYVELLCVRTGKEIPKKKLTNEEADKLIRAMKADLEDLAAMKQEAFDLREQEA